MTATMLFHVGILVPDLDEAMERFADVLHLTWTEKAVAEADMWEPALGHYDLALDVVYSQEGPPHIELVQAQGSGLYRPQLAGGVHHLGGWSPDCERRQAELRSQHLAPVGTQYDPDGDIIVSYFDPAGLYGVMYEMVDEGRRPMMEEWFAGGSFVS